MFEGVVEMTGETANRRVERRFRALKAGAVEFNGGAIDCVVRNRSAAGAALDVASPLGIPERVTLAIGSERVSCRVVWRKETRIGVSFLDPSVK